MLVSFLYPQPFQHLEAPWLWIFYKQMSHIDDAGITYVGSPDYFQPPSHFAERGRWEIPGAASPDLNYRVPDDGRMAGVRRRLIDPGILAPLHRRFTTALGVRRALVLQRFQPLEAALEAALRSIAEEQPVTAVLSWIHCRSLKEVAGRLGIPVIHNEVGPLRRPQYAGTAHFDLTGMNGVNEVRSRYRRWSGEAAGRRRVPLTRAEILDLLLVERDALDGEVGEEYDVGIPLQTEDDQNLLVWNRRLDNFLLLHHALGRYGAERVCIRHHPLGFVDYSRVCPNLDRSASALAFVRRCRRIVTVNSSVALDAVLLGKPVAALGRTPLALLTANSLERLDSWRPPRDFERRLTFYLFGYLIPQDLLFDPEYYRWRLSMPDEDAILQHHLDHYAKRRAASDRATATGPATTPDTGEAA